MMNHSDLHGSQGYDDQYSAEDDLDDLRLPVHVRSELRDRIHRKRSQAGLDYLVIEPKMHMKEQLTNADLEKRERRKASNRNAARRCREKKVQAHQKLVTAKEHADAQIAELNSANARLAQEYQRLVQENKLLHTILSKCEKCRENVHPLESTVKFEPLSQLSPLSRNKPLLARQHSIDDCGNIRLDIEPTASVVSSEGLHDDGSSSFHDQPRDECDYVSSDNDMNSKMVGSPLDLSQNGRSSVIVTGNDSETVALDLRKQ